DTFDIKTSISIHAPRRGSDQSESIKRATLDKISIHAPRRGSDVILCRPRAQRSYFNPRSPQGERHTYSLPRLPGNRFQYTRPAGGATTERQFSMLKTMMSIHAPRRGSDQDHQIQTVVYSRFQSTLPAGGATTTSLVVYLLPRISIHAPRRGSDLPRRSK